MFARRRIRGAALGALSVVMTTSTTAVVAQAVTGFRTFDGTGNNVAVPDRGAAHRALIRLVPPDYADGVAAPAGADRPSARAISETVAAMPVGAAPNARGVSDLFWQWGQFIDHDFALAEETDPEEPFPIPVPRGDPWFDPTGRGDVTISMHRSDWVAVAGVREQTNALTAWIDGSQVYGSDAARALALRGDHGFLATSAGELLPLNTAGLANAPTAHDPTFFVAGDVRANEQVGLIAMHTLFVREHNRFVDALLPLGLEADWCYEIARALVGAEIQAITYREFLPLLLGERALRPYRGYREQVDGSLSNEFSTAAFRFGHSMLSSTLRRLDANGRTIAAGDLALRDAFFAPDEIRAHGIDSVLRGLASQRAQELDPFVIDDVRNFLFGPPGAGGFDLVSLNVQRGRDHGLPSYARVRRELGLGRVRRFGDVTRDPERRERLAGVYARVDDVDLWVGGLSEDPVPGAMVGPVFHRILVDQFERLRDGDRYWYRVWLPPVWADWVERQTLATIIRRNTAIGDELADRPMLVDGDRAGGRGRGGRRGRGR